MGVLPLEYEPGQSAASLGLTGEETFDVVGLEAGLASGFEGGRDVTVRVKPAAGAAREFKATVRIDTPGEVQYYLHGGILRYVLRQLLAK
jgi:aconitate hydratase